MKKLEELPDILWIEEVAKLFWVSQMTLRRWDKSWILQSFRLTDSQHRRYRKDDITNLFNQKNMKDTSRNNTKDIFDDLKFHGIHFTPDILANFVAKKMIECHDDSIPNTINICDPAIGDGSLIIPLYEQLSKKGVKNIGTYWFDIKLENVDDTIRILHQNNIDPKNILEKDFINYILNDVDDKTRLFDFVISNPPYVRTQVLWAEYSKMLSQAFWFTGRVDLYYAFIDWIHTILKESWIAGIIVSNKFMKNKAGFELRKRILEKYDIISIWDFGDTKLFEAAVLPCVLILRKKSSWVKSKKIDTKYVSIYSSEKYNSGEEKIALNVIDAIDLEWSVRIGEGHFYVQKWILWFDKEWSNWELCNLGNDSFNKSIKSKTWKYFWDVWKIKVWVKTTADNVFIKTKWDNKMKESGYIFPLTTHHISKQFKTVEKSEYSILYPYENILWRRKPVDLDKFPQIKEYLEGHFKQLDSRTYIKKSNRHWFEIWVPHNPEQWRKPKIIFRDICKEPTFWIDLEGTIVNWDCYWIQLNPEEDEELLWLMAAIWNSKFIEEYYDHKFNNKIYAGRRRFMSQYVEKFPLLDPKEKQSKDIIIMAKKIFSAENEAEQFTLKKKLNELIYTAFWLN